MPSPKKLTGKHLAGGLNVGTGVFNIAPEENVESRNMEYTIDGAVATSLGAGDPGWNWDESGHSIDGLYRVPLYPNLIWSAVNGKIKYVDATVAPQSSGVPYNADTAISLTAGQPVLFKDYRGMLYYCNGTENFGRIGIGQLQSATTTTPSAGTWSIRTAEYSWVASGSGTTEFFLKTAAGGNPHIGSPVTLLINGVGASSGTLGALTSATWGYGDNDSLGYSTVYVRLSDGADPDSKAVDFVQVTLRQLLLNPAEGYRFTDGVDKVYIEGDEIDYTDEVDGTNSDTLFGVTNVTASHAAASYVTQYNTITPPTSGSAKCKTMEIWRDTLWIAGMSSEPGILRYGQTIDTIGDLTDGSLHDFSDNNNYIVGDGGAITALKASEDRLYVFLKDKIHFITVQFNSSAAPVFTTTKLFTGVYGCPNAFCVTDMEDVIIFFTGKRLIRIGYDPNGQTLIPDEKFDKEILPLLQDADEDQTNARLTYNPATKELRLKYIVGGVSKVLKYHKQQDIYSGPSDEDASCYLYHGRNTYYGDVLNSTVWKIGMTIDSEGLDTIHRYQAGRMKGGNDNWKLYKKGAIRGKKNLGGTLNLLTYVDNKMVGPARPITDANVDPTDAGAELGSQVVGDDDGIGTSGEITSLFPYTYKFLLGRRGKDYSFALSSEESGNIWTAESFEVEWEEMEEEPRTKF